MSDDRSRGFTDEQIAAGIREAFDFADAMPSRERAFAKADSALAEELVRASSSPPFAGRGFPRRGLRVVALAAGVTAVATGLAAASVFIGGVLREEPPRKPSIKLDAASVNADLGPMPQGAYDRIARTLPTASQAGAGEGGVRVTRDDLPPTNTGSVQLRTENFVLSTIKLNNGSLCIDIVRNGQPESNACIHDLGDTGVKVGWHQRPDRSYVSGVVADGINEVTVIHGGDAHRVQVSGNAFVWEAPNAALPERVIYERDGQRHAEEAPSAPAPAATRAPQTTEN